tara:strand:+ start:62 stop:706 length:645 start_codon:yes stop_codon:yes gene_type:complete
MIYDEMNKFFEDNGYIVIENFLKPETIGLLYEYTKLKARRESINEATNSKFYHKEINGKFDDPQAPGAYSLYGDPLMESILIQSRPFIEKFIKLELVPTYAYWRLYITGSDLKKHIDRKSCEYSTTLFLGHDISNIKDKDYNWPIYIESRKKEVKEVKLKPGDMVVYKGCDVEHWRNEFIGLNHAQVFLHYNDKNGKFKEQYDGRKFLGLPSVK